eukprot:TRINITY_DN11420_c0_g1_i1.p2 TRINITY_DN11420_c0_g1~~TRINITY_DN11420_c0_g1_i1.p2  ORF type:complete len:419 (+),score=74.76 TRINITY_DN11420_c0_g1_i1:93-1349(+)
MDEGTLQSSMSTTGKVVLGAVAVVLAGGAGYYFLTRGPKTKRTKKIVVNNYGKKPPSDQQIKSAIAKLQIPKEEAEQLQEALEMIKRDNDESTTEEGVTIIERLTNHKETLNLIRVCGGLDDLLIILAKRSDNENLYRKVLLALANLVLVKDNRLAFDKNAVQDLIYSLSIDNDEIKQASLRTLMNLTVEKEFEVIVREVDGLPVIIDLMKDDESSEDIRFHAVRLLVNLVWNVENKDVMKEYGVLEKSIELISGEPPAALASRLIRLIGFFSMRTNLPTFQKVASTECAKSFAHLLKRYQRSLALIEAIAITVSKITIPREETKSVMEAFRKEFLSAEEGGSIAIISKLLLSSSNTQRYNALCCLSGLAANCELGTQQINSTTDCVKQIREFSESAQGKLQTRALELNELISVPSVD